MYLYTNQKKKETCFCEPGNGALIVKAIFSTFGSRTIEGLNQPEETHLFIFLFSQIIWSIRNERHAQGYIAECYLKWGWAVCALTHKIQVCLILCLLPSRRRRTRRQLITREMPQAASLCYQCPATVLRSPRQTRQFLIRWTYLTKC